MSNMGNPNWVKGVSGNPKGRPPTAKSELDRLRDAVKLVEVEKGITLYAHFVRQAFEDNAVLVALAKKLVPDLKQIDGTQDRKSLNLIGISLNPELQALVSTFLSQMARLELSKGQPKPLKLPQNDENIIDMDAQDASQSTQEE